MSTIAAGSSQMSSAVSAPNFFCLKLGFHLLAGFLILNGFFPATGPTVQNAVVSSLLLASVLLFAVQIATHWQRRGMRRLTSLSALVTILLTSWGLLVILRSIEFDLAPIVTLLTHPAGGALVWLLPLAILIGRQPGVLTALIPSFRLHSQIGIVLTLVIIVDGLVLGNQRSWVDAWAQVGPLLIYGAPVVLLARFGTVRDRRFFFVAQAAALAGHLILSNRAAAVLALVVLALTLVLGRTHGTGRSIVRLGITAVVGPLALYVGYIATVGTLDSSWTNDTRTFLWQELAADFNFFDWLIGRGALGSYYSPYFEHWRLTGLPGDAAHRQGSEVGYLHLILKSGIVGLGLYVLPIALAIVRSMWIDREPRLGIGIALVLLLHLAEMLVIGSADFTPSRVLLWILVGHALSQPRQQSVGARP